MQHVVAYALRHLVAKDRCQVSIGRMPEDPVGFSRQRHVDPLKVQSMTDMGQVSDYSLLLLRRVWGRCV